MNATEETTFLQNAARANGDGAERLIAATVNAAASAVPPAPLPASWMNGQAARGVVQEMIHYTSRRMRAYAQHLEALTQCETMQAAAERQMEFLRESQADIASQMSSMMSLAQAKPATNGHD